MKALGKTIQIYCPSGEPRGVRIAEITTRIVQAVVVPRAKLEEALNRPELAGVVNLPISGGRCQCISVGSPRTVRG